MITLRRRLRAWTWIALVAMLGLALAPTLSRAMSAAAPWQQVCSASAGDTSEAPALHLDHCPLCAVAAAPFAMPPAVALPALRADLAHYLPPLFATASRPLFAWAGPPSRAPPAVS